MPQIGQPVPDFALRDLVQHTGSLRKGSAFKYLRDD